MANPDWPSALYGKILKDGFQEITPDNRLRTEMDQGIPKMRQHQTSGVRVFDVRMFFTLAEVATHETFYITTLNDGILRFDYYAPRTKVEGEFRYVTRPQYTPMKEGYVASFQLEELP